MSRNEEDETAVRAFLAGVGGIAACYTVSVQLFGAIPSFGVERRSEKVMGPVRGGAFTLCRCFHSLPEP